MKFARTLVVAVSVAGLMAAAPVAAQRGGSHGGGGGGFHGGGGGGFRGGGGFGGGYRGGGYGGYHGGYGGYRGGYGFYGRGYGYGYGLFGGYFALGLFGGYALGYPYYAGGYYPYGLDYGYGYYPLDAGYYPDAGYASGPGPDERYSDGDAAAGYQRGGQGYEAAPADDGRHCPLVWNAAERRYLPQCGGGTSSRTPGRESPSAMQ